MTASQTTATPGTIITFYSYKGGTGRTMALANVAWVLASRGKGVLAVDWDLESPGLHRYFHPFLADKTLSTTPGVIDMVRTYSEAVVRPPDEGDQGSEWIASYADVLSYVIQLNWDFSPRSTEPDTKPGFLDLLPAGKQVDTYTKAVSTFDWHAFYHRGGEPFLEALAASMRKSYDYVLIDSRTGVSDGAGICTVSLPDTVVTAFTLNDQSIEGAAAVAHSIIQQRRDRPVHLLPVPMRVEEAEHRKREAGRELARRRFAPLLFGMSADQVDHYWGDVEIPYKPFYAYEEILAAFGDRPHQDGSLLAAYERLTNVISAGQVSQLQPIEETVRLRLLFTFERALPTEQTDIVISYANEDRIWAEWISGELALAGLRTSLREVDFPAEPIHAPDLNRPSRVIVLLSHGYVQSSHAEQLWNEIIERERSAGAPLLVPIRLDNVRPQEPFVERVPVELGLDEERATQTLLRALDVPVPDGAGDGIARSGTVRSRFPATEPPIWNIPPRNIAFTGRRLLLEHVRDQLSRTGVTVMPQALHGLGGVGKSQIVIEYAHRFRADYDVIWWVSSQQASVARASLATLADRLGVVGGESVSDRMRGALDALRLGSPYKRWLLIFDNADDPNELREMLPQGPGHVLLTTRNQAWAREAANLIEVSVFDRTESIALLRRRIPHLSDDDANRVAERLGDLPLAIEQAGAWLSETGEPVSRYLERLEEQLPEMLAEQVPEEYQRTGPQPWLMSLQRLRDQSPAAAKLLEVCAFFAPEPIPMSLIYSDRFINVLLDYDPEVRDPMLMGRTIREISKYALARVDTGQSLTGHRRRAGDRADENIREASIELHRLVQAVIRRSLTPEIVSENRAHVHLILAAASPRDGDQPENWPVFATLWPHVLPSQMDRSADPEVRQSLLEVARYLWRSADYATCDEFTVQTAQRWAQAHGGDDPRTLLMRFHQGNSLRLQAKYRDAYEIDLDVHERLAQSLGDRHEYSIIAASSVAADLRGLGRFTEARDLDRETVDLARVVFGESHTRTLLASHNLAISLRLVGDLKGALRLNESTWMRRRAALSDRHPHSLQSAANYGRDLRDTGQLDQAQRVLEAAMEAHRQVFGERHPETLQVMKNYAVTLRKLGRFEQASEIDSETLSRSLELHGTDHPDVQACAMSLACDESALGRDEDAVQRARPVHEWYRSNMGENHLFTLAYANNLAIFLRKAGDTEAAYEMSRDAVDRFSAAVGADHPYTLAAVVNLANCLYSKHEFEQARLLDEQAYERAQQILGPEHPDTLAVANNLATSLSAVGDRKGAQAIRSAVLPAYQRTLGHHHPNTLALQAANRLNCDLEPPPT